MTKSTDDARPAAGRRRDDAPPFAAIERAAARQYDAWYDTPAGRAMAAEEERLLGRLLTSFPRRDSALEVGCGTGHFARWLAGTGATVVGLDTSPGMLVVARERDGGPAYARASATSLPFGDNTFDLVALIASLEFIADPTLAIREGARVARYGLLLGVLNLASPLGLKRRARAILGPSPYRGARFYTPWGLAGLVRRALGSGVASVEWGTAVWPGWVPNGLRRLPAGAFIGMAVLCSPGRRTASPTSAPKLT